MRTPRILAAFAALTSVLAATLLSGASPASAQATITRLEVTGAPVRAGGSFTVSAGGCHGDGNSVLVGLLDADEEGLLASTAVHPRAEGGWTASLTVPDGTRPGRYPLTARCVVASGYGGYDGYDGGGYHGGDGGTGYNGEQCDGYDGYDGVRTCVGGGSYDYPSTWVVVLPPATPPAADGPLAVRPDVAARGATVRVTGTGWDAGEQVTVVMYSSPVVLATLVTDASGSIDTPIVVPPDAAFATHDVVAMNASSAVRRPLTLRGSLTVVAPRTDRNPPPVTDTSVVPVSQPPTAVPTQVSSGSQAPSGLSFTGTDVALLVVIGAAAVVVGWLLRRGFRRDAPT